MKHPLIITSIFAISVSCNSPQKVKLQTTEKTDCPALFRARDSLRQLLVKAIETNDAKVYNNVVADYMLYNRDEELLYYALVMAYKNNSAEAYHNVYEIIALFSPYPAKETLEKAGEKMKGFAIYHLLKSYEMGYDRAEYQIDELFGGARPKFKDYEQYLY